MRAPKDRNSPVDQARKDAWLDSFAAYRVTVNEPRIDAYLRQFDTQDIDVAARVLDCVEFFGPEKIANAYRSVLGAIPGWSKTAVGRTGEWRFAAMSTTAGESGDSMLQMFRAANGLGGSRFDRMFIHRSELVTQKLGADDSVVFLDDFVGTGNQVVKAWDNAFAELVAGIGNVYLVLVGACRTGLKKVKTETNLQVRASRMFSGSDNIFSANCRHFTPAEKKAFHGYCTRASAKAPAGYGECGLLVVFSHGCPNNSVAALHAKHQQWRGLFPR